MWIVLMICLLFCIPEFFAFSTVSSSALSFLNDNLANAQGLARASNFATELDAHCRDLDRSLTELNRALESKLFVYASFSDRSNSLFSHVNVKLTDLASATRSPSSVAGSFSFLYV